MPVGRSTSPTHVTGSHAEDRALAYLTDQGLTVVTQNWSMPDVGEIDLVMLDEKQPHDVLVFVEVRKRNSHAYGGAVGSITEAKQHKIIQTAQCFLAEHATYDNHDCRFDVVAIEKQDIHWYPAAFMLNG